MGLAQCKIILSQIWANDLSHVYYAYYAQEGESSRTNEELRVKSEGGLTNTSPIPSSASWRHEGGRLARSADEWVGDGDRNTTSRQCWPYRGHHLSRAPTTPYAKHWASDNSQESHVVNMGQSASNKSTNRPTNIQANPLTNKPTNKPTYKQTYMQTNKPTNKLTTNLPKKPYKQTNKQT